MKNKSTVLAAAFGVLAFIGLAFAASTTFTSLKVTGATQLVGGLTNNGAVINSGAVSNSGAITNSAALTSTGLVTLSTATFTGTQGLRLGPAVDVAVSTPLATGILVRDSSNNLYISTGTANPTQWAKVGGQ